MSTLSAERCIACRRDCVESCITNRGATSFVATLIAETVTYAKYHVTVIVKGNPS